jgi:thioredoxin-dependent peroxiredoxin
LQCLCQHRIAGVSPHEGIFPRTSCANGDFGAQELRSIELLCCSGTAIQTEVQSAEAVLAVRQRITCVMANELLLALKEGDLAPAFTVNTNGGGRISLADYLGQNVVLYFYPRDDTPGCTKEACAFRDEYAVFKSKNVVVLGVSIDPVKSHDKFVEKYKIPFTLLADEDKKIVEAYGVWGQKSFLGKKYMGIHRVTFLIAPDGRIKKIWLKVKPTKHAAEVLAAI